MVAFQPVVDGRTVPGPPLERVASGAASGVDVLAGTNTDDWGLLLAITGELGRITRGGAHTGPVAVHGFQALAAYGLSPQDGLVTYRTRYPDVGPGDLLAAVQTDLLDTSEPAHRGGSRRGASTYTALP